MSEALVAAPPVERIEVWRDGGWVLVALDGETVWKRHTRDPAFTHAKVQFYSNRSPAVPRSRLAFQEVYLLGAWRKGKRARWGSNAVELPIAPERGPVYTSRGLLTDQPEPVF